MAEAEVLGDVGPDVPDPGKRIFLHVIQGYIFSKILWWWGWGMTAGEKNEN